MPIPSRGGFRSLPPQIIKGGNLVPRPEDVARFLAWMYLQIEWPWVTWIKPQIDEAKALGCNTIRMIGDIACVTTGNLTRAQYLANQGQFLSYANNIGLWVHGNAGGPPHFNGGVANVGANLSDYSAVIAEVQAYARFASGFPNVFAIDLLSEPYNAVQLGTTIDTSNGDFLNPWGVTIQNQVIAATLAACRLVAPNMPMGFSFNYGNNSNAMWSDTTYLPGIMANSDYGDAHTYYSAGSTDAAPWFAAYPGKSLLHGEFGGPPASSSDATRAAQLTAISAITNANSGGSVWAIVPQASDSADDWGLCNASGSGSGIMVGSERPNVCAAFRALSGQPAVIRTNHRRRRAA